MIAEIQSLSELYSFLFVCQLQMKPPVSQFRKRIANIKKLLRNSITA